jgi:menaquinone-dependent protoporphyrinogen oxidase
MRSQFIFRRRFFALGGVALASYAIGCAGLEVLMAQGDDPKIVIPIGFPEISLGDPEAKKKVLVVYASAAGSTGGAAETIGGTLARGGARVDVRRVQSSPAVDRYDAVVLGSAIHGGKWLKEASAFLDTNKARLNQLPTAFFLMGLMVNKKSPSDQKMVEQFLATERGLVRPVAEGRFVGALFPGKYPGMTGFGMRFFIAYCGLGFRGGDFRNPAAIGAWAESIIPLLIS